MTQQRVNAMPIYEMTSDQLRPVNRTTFADVGIDERRDLQRLLRDQIEVISPDTLVIAEEFSNWEDSWRRVDLLGVDKDAGLVVIELKRTEDGGHMELQAIRYAAMVSAMTFERAADTFDQYLRKNNKEENGEDLLLQFLEWDEPREEEFCQSVRIVLASAEFSKELTTAVMWLNDRDLDIRCVRLRPHQDGDRLLLDIQQVIPLPEAQDYQVRLKTKAQKERQSSARRWNEGSFFSELSKNVTADEVEVVRRIYSQAIEFANQIHWGRGQTVGSFVPSIEFSKVSEMASHWYALFTCDTTGLIAVEMATLCKKAAFQATNILLEFADGISHLPDVRWNGAIDKRLSLPISSLVDEKNRQAFDEALTNLLNQISKWYEDQVPAEGG